MEYKKYIKKLLRIAGICYLNVAGISLIITGAMEEVIWLVLIGVFIVDLSPSFIKTIWKDAWCQGTQSKAHANTKTKQKANT